MATTMEDEVSALAGQMAELGAGERAGVFHMTWWSQRMLAWAMADPAFKTQLFRLVDVFPATSGDADALRHVHEYFAGIDAPRWLDLGVELAERVPLGGRMSASVARRNIARMARQFIVGTTPEEVAANLERLWRAGSAFTVDLLGERTLTSSEADAYALRVEQLLDALLVATAAWPGDEHLDGDDLGPIPRASVSIKPSALAPCYAPLTAAEGKAQAAARLRPLLKMAADRGAFVWLDMERFDVKDLTLELFRELMDEPGLSGLDAGIVLQAYLKSTPADLAGVIEWSASRLGRPGTKPISIRLVKGAYWDAEVIQARAEGWPVPVFEHRSATDASFELGAATLHDSHGVVRAAFGSHNLRSLAYAVSYARRLGIPDNGYELQMLNGMAEPLHQAIRRLGLRLRVYAPMGELVPGMSYLIRRLLENTSNESFVRARWVDNRNLEELVSPPPEPPGAAPAPEPPAAAGLSDPANPGIYRHQATREWRVGVVRGRFAETVSATGRRLDAGSGGIDVPAVIGGEQVRTGATLVSVDPAEPERVVATATSAGTREADEAVAVAMAAAEKWRRTPVADRAAVLFKASAWLRIHRDELAALEVFEVGKPWAEADADVCEAVDFCEYYGRQMLRLDAGGAVESPPGETNSLRYGAKGVGVVISPWNFPLAIPAGMVAAALVTGNAVVLKPAEQSPAVAAMLVEALLDSGLPPGVLAFLPGAGETVGDHLVRHGDVAFVAFTGSLPVGLAINAAAAIHRPGQRQVKRVVAEMGGKNAMVVDADADLDQVVPAVMSSAFGYAGQKCSAASRLIVVDDVHDQLVARLVGAARQLVIGHPRHPGVTVGPLIDAEAQTRVRRYVAGASRGPGAGRVVLARDDLPGQGYFVGPTVVDGVAASSALARDEVFGPVLAVLAAGSFEQAVEVANDTDYALTAGVFSRSPSHIAMASAELRAGNVYVNRAITGAVPGRQPFGGYGLSGVGSKAGGPDYLLAFLDPRVVTENTLRQGFAPDDAAGGWAPPPMGAKAGGRARA